MNPFVDCTWNEEPTAGDGVWVCKSIYGEVVATVGAAIPRSRSTPVFFETLWGEVGHSPDLDDAMVRVDKLLAIEAERWAASDVFKPAEFDTHVGELTAESQFSLLCDIFATYHKTQVRAPCVMHLDGERYNILMRLTQPTAGGLVLQTPNYFAVHGEHEKAFYEARKAKQPVAVPLALVFIPAEQELLHQMTIVQSKMTPDECRRAEMAVLTQSDDPELQQMASGLAVADPMMPWGAVNLSDEA